MTDFGDGYYARKIDHFTTTRSEGQHRRHLDTSPCNTRHGKLRAWSRPGPPMGTSRRHMAQHLSRAFFVPFWPPKPTTTKKTLACSNRLALVPRFYERIIRLSSCTPFQRRFEVIRGTFTDFDTVDYCSAALSTTLTACADLRPRSRACPKRVDRWQFERKKNALSR